MEVSWHFWLLTSLVFKQLLDSRQYWLPINLRPQHQSSLTAPNKIYCAHPSHTVRSYRRLVAGPKLEQVTHPRADHCGVGTNPAIPATLRTLPSVLVAAVELDLAIGKACGK